jgi:hypothetical protein
LLKDRQKKKKKKNNNKIKAVCCYSSIFVLKITKRVEYSSSVELLFVNGLLNVEASDGGGQADYVSFP